MAKSKNHTAKNQSNKAHKNGIKRPKTKGKYTSLKGMDRKFLKNRRFAMRGLLRAKKAADLAAIAAAKTTTA
ncbi:MAG: eL29 family ribosomal protein [archaeon]|nr:eL29 family ribosomal protein [archaeon]